MKLTDGKFSDLYPVHLVYFLLADKAIGYFICGQTPNPFILSLVLILSFALK